MSIARKLLMGAAGGKSDPVYVDDIFSTYLYKGTESTHTVNNGIDLSTEGGLVWIKARSGTTQSHSWVDTERGAGYQIESNTNTAQTYEGTPTFNTNGFTVVGAGGQQNANGADFVSWTFRKQEGFFDIVTYTGDGTASKTINHSLGSIPGIIIARRTDSWGTWVVYHKNLGNDKLVYLNDTSAEATNMDQFDKTDPTASSFIVEYTGTGASDLNVDGATYVAYLFAGGESTADTARSVEFDGTGDVLTLASSSDFNFGTGDFTFEGWLKPNNNTDFQVFLNWGSDNPSIGISNDSNSYIYYNSTVNTKIAGIAAIKQWTHYAISRSSGTTRLFLNGELTNSFSDSHNYGAQALSIGAYSNANFSWNGLISNVRIVKGTAVYTSSFRPPTEPLTNITNTKLLCCNNSSTTGSTVTPGTITATGTTASTDSPFDDPEGYKFGEDGDQNVIKCGSYKGNGQSNESGPFTYLGWEPQVLFIKNTTSASSWAMLDTMRGIRTGGETQTLSPNTQNGEGNYTNFATVTSTGFYAGYNDVFTNKNNNNYIYMAIRSVDGLVSKPPEAGTDVLAMDTGNSSTTIPALDSDFPVGMAFYKKPATSGDWYLSGRLMSNQKLQLESIVLQATDNDFVFDSNVGWYKGSYMDTTYQSWMFKRGQSFDVITYMGNNAYRSIPHSLGRPPEMIWIKKRSANSEWVVGHIGLNAGTNPWNYRMHLSSAGTGAAGNYWSAPGAPTNTGTAPTSTVFSLGTSSESNSNLNPFIAMLFASVDGISKCGYYTGNSTADRLITTGFQPRFIIIRRSDATDNWYVRDTVRGLAKELRLNSSASQNNAPDQITFVSNGFQIPSGGTGPFNSSGEEIIYYAHA